MTTRLLLTGATGYIGGSILSALLSSNEDVFQQLSISALVRREDQAEVLKDKGVGPILFRDLDDVDHIQHVASDYDVVINCSNGFHSGSARALILGLGERRKTTGKHVFYIHTSGTSNMGDRPITGKYLEDRTFSDHEKIYEYEKFREAIEPYEQRTTDIVVVETGLSVDVKTYIIMSPTIYGPGSGSFNNLSIQIPTMIRSAIRRGQAEMVEQGTAEWDHVHICDLALLYELILTKVLSGDLSLPSGEKAIFFSETGQHTWKALSQGIARAGVALGALKSEGLCSQTLEETAQLWSGGSLQRAELGYASNSRTRANLSRELGWKPRKTEEDWKANFKEEFNLILANGTN